MLGNVVAQECESKENFIFWWRTQTSNVSNMSDGIRHDVDILTDLGSVKQQVGSSGRPSVCNMVVFLWRCKELFQRGRGRQKMFLRLSRLLIFLPLALQFWVSVLKRMYHHNYAQYILVNFIITFSFYLFQKSPVGGEIPTDLCHFPCHVIVPNIRATPWKVRRIGNRFDIGDVFVGYWRHLNGTATLRCVYDYIIPCECGIIEQDCVAVTHIPEVLGSNVSRNTEYCDLDFCNFPQFPRASVRILTRPLLSKAFPIHDSASTIWRRTEETALRCLFKSRLG